MNLKDKKVLITGSSRGIGLATAKRFLDLGAHVVVNGRSQESVDKALEELNAGNFAVGFAADVATVKDCNELVGKAVKHLGGLDVLVNSAGIAYFESIEETTEEHWDHTMNVNVKGTFFCCQAALPALKASGGNIINISSTSGMQGESFPLAAYCGSKAAVINMSRTMALELAPQVRVNVVSPGTIDTDMVRDIINADEEPQALEDAVCQSIPLGRLGKAEEVAKTICFLASSDAEFMTGNVVVIDGGSLAG